MTDRSCGTPEERWVDWHLRRLSPETMASMERHLEGCPDCRFVCRQWGEWLETGRLQETGSLPEMPSDRVRKSLRRKIWRRILRNWLRSRTAWQSTGIVAAAAAVLFGAGWLLLGGTAAGTATGSGQSAVATLEPKEYARLHQPEGAVLMSRPDTVVYTLDGLPASGLQAGRGSTSVTVWLNGRTEELFVLVDGLLPAGSRDVQAWGEVHRQLTNLGLLEFHQTQGHLYSHIRWLPEVEELAFTIEPKGGSLRPTAPESARVRLAAEK